MASLDNLRKRLQTLKAGKNIENIPSRCSSSPIKDVSEKGAKDMGPPTCSNISPIENFDKKTSERNALRSITSEIIRENTSTSEFLKSVTWTSQKRNSNTGTCDTQELMRKHNENTNTTMEFTDYLRTWMNRIEVNGNRAEDWLEFTRYANQTCTFTNNVVKHNYLCNVYEKAFKAIPMDLNKRNEAYAKLFMESATLKSAVCPEEAIQVMSQARAMVKRFADVHVMAAQLECMQGNTIKAKKILEKAQLFGAEPREVIDRALQHLQEGCHELISTEGSNDVRDLNNPVKQSPPCSKNAGTIDLPQHQFDMPNPQNTIPSTRQHNKGLRLPQRVKRLKLPFNEVVESDEENDQGFKEGLLDDTLSRDIKPLDRFKEGLLDDTLSRDIKPLDNHTNYTLAHSSGYCSMMDVTVPMETSDKNISPTNSTAPCDLDKNISPNTSPDPPMNFDSMEVDGAPCVNRTRTDNLKSLEGNHFPKPVNYKVLSKSESASVLPSQRAHPVIQKVTSDSQLCQSRDPPVSQLCYSKDHPVSRYHSSDHPMLHEPIDSNHNKQPLGEPVGAPPQLKPETNTIKHPHTTPMSKGGHNSLAPLGHSGVPPSAYKEKGLSYQHQPVGPTPVKQNGQPESNAMLVTPSMKGIPKQIPCTPNMMKELVINNCHYWVQKILGTGGSSKVYKVIDSTRDFENKAVKVVNLANTNEQIVEGYRNEIKLLERLQYCPKVIKMYDYEFVEENSTLFIVMECGTIDFAHFMKSKLKDTGHLSPHGIKYFWEDMLQGVGALHDEGIIHSDLKPSNFLLIDGNLKLIDFGIAKTIQTDKTSVFVETQVGTMNYMSPETIIGTCGGDGFDGDSNRQVFKIGVKSDVWSLGCILYYMVYGHTPFQKITKTFAKLQAITNPKYPIDFKEIQDSNLLDVIKSCLTRDPKKRPSIKELLEHPYVTGLQKAPRAESVSEDPHMERLVMQLADKFASSPTGIRNMVKTAIRKGDM